MENDEELNEVVNPYPTLPINAQKHMFQKGNPGGPGQTLGKVMVRTILKRVLQSEFNFDNPLTLGNYKMSVNEAIALKLVKKALDGNLRAIEMIFERVDGKVADMLQLGNIDDKPLETSSTLKYDFTKLSVEELMFVRNVLKKTTAE